MPLSAPFSIFIVDDSASFRKILSSILGRLEGVEVIGSADSGSEALAQIPQVSPDLVTLNLTMPGVDGLDTLRRLNELPSPPVTIIISEETKDLATTTIKALQANAYDVVSKPTGLDYEVNTKILTDKLTPLIKTLICTKISRVIAEQSGGEDQLVSSPCTRLPTRCATPEVVAIGASTGGPAALTQLLKEIPKDFPVPILLTQHLTEDFTGPLAQSLNNSSPLHVVEAEDGQIIAPGYVYLAPGNYQMRIKKGAGNTKVVLTDDPPENFCKPSVDYLFRSVADVYQEKCLGIILTGMGLDGVEGLSLIRAKGGQTLAQDKSTSAVFGMPGAAIAAGVVDHVAPLHKMPSAIKTRVMRDSP